MAKTILVIEDELYIREMYEYVLKQANYTILSGVDGMDGLKKALQKPDLILLDIMMPKMNGLDVLKNLKTNEQTKHIPVVLITNLAERSVISEAFDLGAQGYILKVRFDPVEVVNTVKLFIDNPTYILNIKSDI